MQLSLERRWRSETATIGELFIDGVRECYILEDRVREIDGIDVLEWKVSSKTAIPSGRYRVVRDYSNRFQRTTIHLINVPGFSGIRIHAGNLDVDTDGCLLPGITRDGNSKVLQSVVALKAIEAKVDAALKMFHKVWIGIVNPAGPTPEQMDWLA